MRLYIRNISKSYGSLQVLKDFSLTINQGITTILAPSGSGKTTLLRLIAGLEAPDLGSISTSGQVSYLFQEDRLLPSLTAEENIRLVATDGEAARLWLEKVGLKKWGSAYPHQLSGGMNRRIALARALAFPSEILLLDEPFKGLDLGSKTKLIPLITQHNKRGVTLIITHDLQEAVAFGGKILKGWGPPLETSE